ncbi:MAG: hypothetical protein Q7S22_02525 [Candidatus Micrarchaeota archaeon]|nr:hypothetical protein [Candidatus Micrarchaeota archaeon]
MATPKRILKPVETPVQEQPKILSLGDFITQPINQWIDYIRQNAVKYYVGLLKIELLAIAIFSLIILVFGLISFGALALLGGFQSSLALVVSGIIFLIGLILASWSYSSIQMTELIYTDCEFNNKEFAIIKSAKEISGKVLRFIVVDTLIITALMIPGAIIVIVFIAGGAGLSALKTSSGSNPLIGIMGLLAAYFILIIYFILVMFIYGILTQFWRYGFIIENLGIRESLKKSISIVKRKPSEVLIVIIVLGLITGSVFSIPSMIYYFFAQIGMNILSLTLSFGPIGIIIFVIGIVVHILISTVLGVIPKTFSVPTRYLFWKMIKDM